MKIPPIASPEAKRIILERVSGPKRLVCLGLDASGRNLANRIAEITGIVRARGIIQAPKSANAVPTGASINRVAILAAPKAPFSTGTHTARRSPTRTLSSIVNIAIAAAASTRAAD